ncbi:MAG: nicotinate phosphoribosyltransferase [Myxococcota bacterium]
MTTRPMALLTDLYQLTMAHGYWRHGLAEQRAVFQLTFRKPPFGSGYTVAAGLEPALEYLAGWRFEGADLEYLATLTGNDGQPLFPAAFLDYLGGLSFACDVDAVPEGTIVFPHEPLLRVTGPLVQAQIVETALLNLVNFQTLIATKAARVCNAAKGDPVLEFGLRRAQGIDGGLAASRAAYLGGCAATSNVLAGRLFGIPVRGTHAHSWVMTFDNELESFLAYAEAMPNNCVFLVDTYDTLDGVRNAIQVGQRLRASGHELIGIRLDSGDLAELSARARDMLDAAGFEGADIIASNDLDETLIESLKHQGAKIDVWGVGTRLVTGYDQPALGGVYKLAAVAKPDGSWDYKIKLSEQPIKVSNPGVLQVRRFIGADGAPVGDVIYDEALGVPSPASLRDPLDATFRRSFSADLESRDLLVPVLRGGRRVAAAEPLEASRSRARLELAALPGAMRRFLNPQRYAVGLEEGLWQRRQRYVLEARAREDQG